jgi:hypothetical protein
VELCRFGLLEIYKFFRATRLEQADFYTTIQRSQLLFGIATTSSDVFAKPIRKRETYY